MRQLRAEAIETRWPWTLPVESGYAASMVEVQRDWNLGDVLTVQRRVIERARQTPPGGG